MFLWSRAATESGGLNRHTFSTNDSSQSGGQGTTLAESSREESCHAPGRWLNGRRMCGYPGYGRPSGFSLLAVSSMKVSGIMRPTETDGLSRRASA